MKLEKFKEKDHKRIGIIVFTITCILLVSGVVLYRTFAIFEVKTSQNVINGTVQDPGNIYFAFYVDEKIQKDMPQINSGYILDEDASYCGINGQEDEKIHVSLTEDYTVHVSGMTTSRTKCNLYFVRGAFILGKPIKAVTSGDGLYEVKHEDSSLDEGFKQTEWRYAGSSPNNYIKFNDEDWRIIGLVNVKTGDGFEQRVKIIKDEMIGKYAWNSNNVNDWTQASLMTELNDNYYQNSLNNTAQNMIASDIIWNLGGSSTDGNVTASMFYERERGTTTNEGQSSKWNPEKPSIALPYPSDYVYATSGGTKGREGNTGCFAEPAYFWGGTWVHEDAHTQCAENDWLKPTQSHMWTLMPNSSKSSNVFNVVSDGYIDAYPSAKIERPVYPTLYLKQRIKIVNDENDGSQNKPYTLSVQ